MIGKIYWGHKMTNIVGIVQARLGSTRLPNKVIKKLGNKTILEILLNRLIKSKTISRIVIATTTKKEDDIIEKIALNSGFEVFRGSEKDVLDRFYNAAREYNAGIIVRITADNPLTDVDLIDSQVEFLIEGGYDYVTAKGIILGLGSEVFTLNTLKKAWENAKEKYLREHVTPYIYENPEMFKLGYVDPPDFLKREDIRLTIDTIEDFKLYQMLYHYFRNLVNVDIREVIKFLDENPNIKEINKAIRQKNYEEVEE